MPTVNLYNLDLGPNVSGRWTTASIGPFTVSLVPNYEEKRAGLPAHGSKTVSRAYGDLNDSDGLSTNDVTVEYTPARPGGWVVTATATYDEDHSPLNSILAREAIADHGLWDLCTLLTFTTGRRVVTDTALDRFDPNCYGASACIAIETLHATALAWSKREDLVRRRLTYALQMHNEALGYNMLQVVAALNSIALNVIVDRWSSRPSSPEPSARRELKSLVVAAVDNCERLSVPEQNAFKALLGSRIDQGLDSLTARTRALLCDLGVIGSEAHAETDRRIGFANSIRNRLVHSGEPPLLKGLSPEQSMRYTLAIATGVVPQITITAVGYVLGFRRNATGSLSQNTDELTSFFEHGIWRGWPLEEVSFEDWFYSSED